MSAFEIITKEEFESSRSDGGAGSVGVDNSIPSADDMESAPTLIWCEFCKGNYIEELHVERWEGVK